MPSLSAPCEITLVDFSEAHIAVHQLNNDNLVEFLKIPQPKGATCRWINVNGLSWDVIQALGQYKTLHKLAIEDIMNTRNRTKAEWFASHAFIVLTLQKLVHVRDTESDSEDEEEEQDTKIVEPARQKSSRPNWLSRKVRRLFGLPRKRRMPDVEPAHDHLQGRGIGPTDWYSRPKTSSDERRSRTMRTLQRHHSQHWQPSDERTQYMEKNSALASKDLAVAAEQVSMFLMDDNTLISFFEASAQDVEEPIIRRLQTVDTILRRSCDASMLAQAVIDAIIDLAIPVAACYQEVIGDLELDVITSPTIQHTKRLYIMITEINKILSFISPITTLITAMRDHKADMAQEVTTEKLRDSTTGVIITPLTYTYLGDVLDHSILITEELNQIKNQGSDMIDLIFNTISAYTNETMKQLTFTTILFLPLTFLTGYYGQNFELFPDLKKSISYFWKIAAPVVVGTVLILMRGMIWNFIRTTVQRYRIGQLRKDRRERRRLARKKASKMA